MGEILIKFECNNDELFKKLSEIGKMPLPPYIKRNETNKSDDNFNYQTVFAKNLGAVAAPTAGLHFTNELLKTFRNNKINIDYVTLHVGAGTFLPVKTENINSHKMHSEWGEVSNQVVEKINNCKRNGGKIISIGTTTLRILETAFAKSKGILKPYSGHTNIFIKPGYNFNSTDILLTNFHLPKSTLLMLVYAFGGIENIKSAYQYAIENKYRFFSYGDCCLIRKSNE
jgi:S-adenosylmethionine:tRNA ribosyltransferase-isomerase